MKEMVLKKIQEEEFSTLKTSYYVTPFVSIYYCNSLLGIYLDNTLIGLMNTSPLFGNLSIDIIIFPEYRRNGYATMALNKFVSEANFYSDIKEFYCMCLPNNEAIKKVLKNANWHITSAYDEAMLAEGGSFYNIYYQENPFYKAKTKTRI